MKKVIFILSGIGLCILLIIAWIVAVNAKTTAEKQLVLINQATVLMDRGIYIRAVPLLEEAAQYDAVHTLYAETKLKRAYFALMKTGGISRKYTTLLDKQMNRRNAESTIFIEAAEFYLETSKIQEALAVLRNGIEKTGDVTLVTLYENSRYSFEINRTAYEDVTALYGQTIQVKLDGKWGIANVDGSLLIPCEYDKISNFSRERAIVNKDDEIYAIDKNNNRIAISPEGVTGFGNYGNDRIPLYINGGWVRASGEFDLGSTVFEDIGMYSGGFTAAKTDGKWGVIDLANEWLITPQYDDVIKDGFGRCFAQGAVFVRSGDLIYLTVNGIKTANIYDDARPFGNEGYAAVKKNGYWGFIDTAGNEIIPFIYDDALSFGQHLAAVKYGNYWGYISIYGHMVIKPQFLNAKSFSEGSAPVLTQRGWQIITLLEMKRGLNL